MEPELLMSSGETNKKEGAAEKETARPEKYVDEGVEKALSFIRGSYEGRKNPRENLAFHNTSHTKRVIDRVGRILDALGVDERHKQIGRVAGAFHDPIQNWEAKEMPNESIQRSRFAGKNEEESFALAAKFMDETNEKEGEIIFTDEDKKETKEAIFATIPGWDKEHSTVSQDLLKPESSLVTRALALADLGAAGMDGPAQYVFEGNALFREENLDILDAMSDPEKRATLTDEQKENFRKRMLGWSDFQPKFADGRKARFEMEIAGLPEDGKEKLRKLFNKFDASIEASRKKAKERESMVFEELAKDFGY